MNFQKTKETSGSENQERESLIPKTLDSQSKPQPVTGSITNITAEKIEISTFEKQTYSFILSPNTQLQVLPDPKIQDKIQPKPNNKQFTIADLQKNYKVSVFPAADLKAAEFIIWFSQNTADFE